MSERDVIESTIGEMTTSRALRDDLIALGVRTGDCLLVHASLSKLGWMPMGTQLAAQILVDSVGPDGLIVMPTFTAQNSDPANWNAPPVPQGWHEEIRRSMPAYDPAFTPSRNMGAVNEVIRTMPGAVRDSHPRSSFTAIGKRGAELLADYNLEAEFGEGSILARLYDQDAFVLLLGSGFASCTCFHLAEHRAGNMPRIKEGVAMMVDGQRQWVRYWAVDYYSDDFAGIGVAFEPEAKTITHGKVGQADCRLFSLREAVDFAAGWMRDNR